jgi:hypothetical protein
MELFQNAIEIKKFRFTNAIWNALKLNSPMNVGYVTNLIESRTFCTKEEWREFYYESGKKRLQLERQNGFSKDLNQNYGRTEDELRISGKKLFAELERQGNPLNITLAECVFMVKYRVIGETWNGVIMREKNTVKNLGKLFPNYLFKKVDGEIDYKYGIDYEVYIKDQLVCALQIKPMSYEKGISPEIMKAKNANRAKNELYLKEKGVSVFYVYSKVDGTLINQEILTLLNQYLEVKSVA